MNTEQMSSFDVIMGWWVSAFLCTPAARENTKFPLMSSPFFLCVISCINLEQACFVRTCLEDPNAACKMKYFMRNLMRTDARKADFRDKSHAFRT